MAFIEKGDRTAFQRALRLGHGSAGVYLDEFGDAGVEEDILHACRVNLCYDKQCEDCRAGYLFKLIQITNRTHFYFQNIIVASRDANADMHQICGILALAAQNGFEAARPVVYQIFENGLANDAWHVDDVVLMDGLPGLLKADDIVESKLGSNAEIPSYGFSFVIEDLKKGLDWDSIGIDILEAAKTRPMLQKSLIEVKEREDLQGQNKKPKSPYTPIETPEQFFDQLEREEKPSRWKRPLLPGNIRSSSEAIRTLAAETLVRSDDPNRQKLLLRTFGFIDFPLDPELLFPLLNSDDSDVQRWTGMALSNISSRSIHDHVFVTCHGQLPPHIALKILNLSTTAEDAPLVLQLAISPQGLDEQHWSLSRAIEIYENTPEFDSQELLIFAYENQPCSFCREHAVEWLIKEGYLTDAIRRECRWDAVERTRALVAAT